MNEVSCFKTKDGKIFEDKLEAEKHDKFIRFHENYIGDPILDSRGNPVVSENIYHFLSENFGWVEKLFASVPGEDIPLVDKTVDISDLIIHSYAVRFEGKLCKLSLTNRGTIKLTPVE